MKSILNQLQKKVYSPNELPYLAYRLIFHDKLRD